MNFMVIINNKGGVGKTTSAVNLAASLAWHGKRVLLVDLDPSASASIHLGFDQSTRHHATLCDFLLNNDERLQEYIYPTPWERLFCLPSEPALSEFYDEVQQEEDIEFFIRKDLFDNDFDLVLFDSPPNMGNLALNALAIADYALIPIQTQYLAVSGLDLSLVQIDKARRRLNPDLQILGYFGTHYDRRTNVAKEVYASLRERFGDKVFDTVIGVNSKLIEAYGHRKPVMYYAPSARGAKEYKQLASEIIKRIEVKS
ncbi:MAG: AAA family ATPase [Caldithrix sp.]|nr:AAA family ATPase [Caldithrix sp.]